MAPAATAPAANLPEALRNDRRSISISQLLARVAEASYRALQCRRSPDMNDVNTWLAALEERHLADLTRPELTRALRALSSCYVERRDKLTSGAALDGAGKRAAFALFYGPLHFLTVSAVVRALLAHEI